MRIETFAQRVSRVTEPALLEKGVSNLGADQAAIFMEQALKEIRLDCFAAEADFPSYVLPAPGGK